MASDTRPKLNKQGQPREQVVIKPGFHLSDWLRLMKTPGTDFSTRGGGPPKKVTIEELATHNTKYDCWTAYNGKVYNVSNYLPYHPGGEDMLMKGAGRDCTALFKKYHAWVNAESMLSQCYVGTLIVDAEPEKSVGVSVPESAAKEKDPDVEELTTKIATQILESADDKEP